MQAIFFIAPKIILIIDTFDHSFLNLMEQFIIVYKHENLEIGVSSTDV